MNGGTRLWLAFRNRCAFGEPIVHHGPFVMNTHAELRQAFDDVQNGRF